MVMGVRARGRDFLVPGILSLVHFAAPDDRSAKRRRLVGKFLCGVSQDLRDVFSEAQNRRDAVLHFALPAGRGAAFENGAAVPARPARPGRTWSGERPAWF